MGVELELFVDVGHELGGGNVFPFCGGRAEDEGEAGETFVHPQGEVGEGVDGEVFPYRRRWDGCAPVKGQVDPGGASCEVVRRVLCSEDQEGGEGGRKSGGRWGVGRGAHAILRAAKRRLCRQ